VARIAHRPPAPASQSVARGTAARTAGVPRIPVGVVQPNGTRLGTVRGRTGRAGVPVFRWRPAAARDDQDRAGDRRHRAPGPWVLSDHLL